MITCTITCNITDNVIYRKHNLNNKHLLNAFKKIFDNFISSELTYDHNNHEIHIKKYACEETQNTYYWEEKKHKDTPIYPVFPNPTSALI